MKAILKNKIFSVVLFACLVVGSVWLVLGISSDRKQELSVYIERMLRLEEVNEKAWERYSVEYEEDIKILEEFKDMVDELPGMHEVIDDKETELRYALFDIASEELEYAGFGSDLIDLGRWQGWGYSRPPGGGDEKLFTKKGYDYFYNVNLDEILNEYLNLTSGMFGEVAGSEIETNKALNVFWELRNKASELLSISDDVALYLSSYDVLNIISTKHFVATLGAERVEELLLEGWEPKFDVISKDRTLRLSEQLLADSEPELQALNPEFYITRCIVDDISFTYVQILTDTILTDTEIRGGMIIETSSDDSEYTIVHRLLYLG